MGDVVDFNPIRRQLRSGGEPPDNGDMEPRIAKLEALAEKTGDRLSTLEIGVARLETRVDVGFKSVEARVGEQFKHMETRIESMDARIGERFKTMETRMEGMDARVGEGFKNVAANFASKADVAEAKNSVIMWVVSAIFLAQLLPAVLKKFGF